MNATLPRYDNELEQVLAYHGGDARAAIRALLEDRDFLLREIEIASSATSTGYARGWKPTVFSR